MEEKKFDINSILGFVLIGAILIWVMYNNQPTEEEIKAEKAKQEQVEKAKDQEQKSYVNHGRDIHLDIFSTIALVHERRIFCQFFVPCSCTCHANTP